MLIQQCSKRGFQVAPLSRKHCVNVQFVWLQLLCLCFVSIFQNSSTIPPGGLTPDFILLQIDGHTL